MTNSISRKTIALCLVFGVVLGISYVTWSQLQADDAGVGWASAAHAAVSASESSAGDAVPAAAHLSLWEEDTILGLVNP